MANDWILDVLADLRTFARENRLPALADGLDELTLVAAAEISSHRQDGPDYTGHGASDRRPADRPSRDGV